MYEYIDILKNSEFFSGITQEDLERMYHCLSPMLRTYKKGDIIIAGEMEVKEIGIVASGELISTKETAEGVSVLISEIKTGDVIGEILAGSAMPKSPVTILAQNTSTILFFPYWRVANICPRGCPCHNEMLRNVIQLISRKYINLHERIACLALRSVREKIQLYLKSESQKSRSNTFSIPFNREELATYLNIERSALSRELSRMRDDKLLDFYKNTFKITF